MSNREVDKLINEVSEMILLYISKNKEEKFKYRSKCS
jgi:hypothetical protein